MYYIWAYKPTLYLEDVFVLAQYTNEEDAKSMVKLLSKRDPLNEYIIRTYK